MNKESLELLRREVDKSPALKFLASATRVIMDEIDSLSTKVSEVRRLVDVMRTKVDGFENGPVASGTPQGGTRSAFQQRVDTGT